MNTNDILSEHGFIIHGKNDFVLIFNDRKLCKFVLNVNIHMSGMSDFPNRPRFRGIKQKDIEDLYFSIKRGKTYSIVCLFFANTDIVETLV